MIGLTVWGQPIRAKEDTPAVTDYINDYAGIIDDSDQQAMEEMGRELAQETGSQVVVVTLDSLDGQDAAMLATDIGNNAQVGSGKLDNGVVILVSIDDKQRFMAVGSGLEGTITDIDAEHLQQDYLVPQFRNGDYSQGLYDLYGAVVRSIEAGTASGELASDPNYGGEEDGDSLIFGFLAFMAVLVVMMIILGSALSKRSTARSILLEVGENYQLKVKGINFADAQVVVSSSNPEVASITPDGLIHARKVGHTTITVDTPELGQRQFDVKVSTRYSSSRRNDDLMDALFWGAYASGRRRNYHSHHDDHWSSGGGFGGFGGGGGFSGGGGGFSGGGSGGSW